MLKTVVALTLFSLTALAAPAPHILYVARGAHIVRMAASHSQVVWQEAGSPDSDHFLFSMDIHGGKAGSVEKLSMPRIPILDDLLGNARLKRPFAPAVAGDVAVFGAGRINEPISVVSENLKTGKSEVLDEGMRFIVDPSVAVDHDGQVRAAWERGNIFDDAHGAPQIELFEGTKRALTSGPIFLRDEIPASMWDSIGNEYPRLYKNDIVFQNSEYGTPSVYRCKIPAQGELSAGDCRRLSPSARYQERPTVNGDVTAWEESEFGYQRSGSNDVMLYDEATHQVRKLNAAVGYHDVIRVYGDFVAYDAQRTPVPGSPGQFTHPEVKLYDLDGNQEFGLEGCLSAEPVLTHAFTDEGLVVAQNTPSGARIVLVRWSDIQTGACEPNAAH